VRTGRLVIVVVLLTTLPRVWLAGISLTRISSTWISLTRISMARTCLTGITLSRISLTRSALSRMTLARVSLIGILLTRISLCCSQLVTHVFFLSEENLARRAPSRRIQLHRHFFVPSRHRKPKHVCARDAAGGCE
jgi:hypothetical protein